jgi:predicted ArsR family transcriptional regulator
MIPTDLFDFYYPESPGSQNTDTSREAARSMDNDASTLRGQCLSALGSHDQTADEIAESVGESILTIRPRVTELKAKGKVFDSGKRRPNESGRNAIVWTLTKPEVP